MQGLVDVEMAESVVQPQLVTSETLVVDPLAVPSPEGKDEAPPPTEWEEVDDGLSFVSANSYQFSDNDVTVPGTEEEEQTISKPLNMALLKACIEAGRPFLDRIADQDVCLVLGKTGSGKSTLLQGIAGKKFQSKVYEIEGESLNKIVYEAEDALEEFKIGHDKVSETSFSILIHLGGKTPTVMKWTLRLVSCCAKLPRGPKVFDSSF